MSTMMAAAVFHSALASHFGNLVSHFGILGKIACNDFFDAYNCQHNNTTGCKQQIKQINAEEMK